MSASGRALALLRMVRAAMDRGAVAQARALLVDAERLLEGDADGSTGSAEVG